MDISWLVHLGPDIFAFARMLRHSMDIMPLPMFIMIIFNANDYPFLVACLGVTLFAVEMVICIFDWQANGYEPFKFEYFVVHKLCLVKRAAHQDSSSLSGDSLDALSPFLKPSASAMSINAISFSSEKMLRNIVKFFAALRSFGDQSLDSNMVVAPIRQVNLFVPFLSVRVLFSYFLGFFHKKNIKECVVSSVDYFLYQVQSFFGKHGCYTPVPVDTIRPSFNLWRP